MQGSEGEPTNAAIYDKDRVFSWAPTQAAQAWFYPHACWLQILASLF